MTKNGRKDLKISIVQEDNVKNFCLIFQGSTLTQKKSYLGICPSVYGVHAHTLSLCVDIDKSDQDMVTPFQKLKHSKNVTSGICKLRPEVSKLLLLLFWLLYLIIRE